MPSITHIRTACRNCKTVYDIHIDIALHKDEVTCYKCRSEISLMIESEIIKAIHEYNSAVSMIERRFRIDGSTAVEKTIKPN